MREAGAGEQPPPPPAEGGGGGWGATPRAAREGLAGVAAGGAAVLTGYPFDTVKVNLQKGGHSGALACTRHLIRTQGVRGLFRGVSAPLVGGSLEAGVNYGVFARLYDALTAGDGRAFSPAAGGLLAGAAAGVPIAVMLGPTELVKCRLQVAETARMGRDVRSAVRFILATEGWRGLMRGTGATLAREVPGNALYFGVYEALKHTDAFRLEEGAGPLQRFGGTIVCGGLAGVAMWCACLPIDNLKTQIQTVRPGSAADLSLVGHLRRVVRLRGVSGLYAGLAPTIVRAFPANAAQWLVWDLASSALGVSER